MSTNQLLYVSDGPSSNSSLAKSKAKNRVAVNGKERVNGSKRDSKRDARGRWQGTEINGEDEERPGESSFSSSRQSCLDPAPTQMGPVLHRSRNGVNSHRPVERLSSMPPPPQPSISYANHEDLDQRDTPRFYHNTFLSSHEWPGAFTGPASGFLQNPHGTFGRMTQQNPGRTIYSPEFHGNGTAR